MPFDFTTISNLVQTPSGLLVSAVGIWGVVFGAFKVADDLLTKDAKFEIAVSILDVRLAATVTPWTEVFRTRLFEWLFGPKHLSWRCFLSSSALSIGAFFFFVIVVHPFVAPKVPIYFTPVFWIGLPLWIALANYGSLLPTRQFLRRAPYSTLSAAMLSSVVAMVASVGWMLAWSVIVWPWLLTFEEYYGIGFEDIGFEDLLLFLRRCGDYYALVWVDRFATIKPLPLILPGPKGPFVNAAANLYFCSLVAFGWLAAYGMARLILKAAFRFDPIFDWCNGKANIEEKPLQYIGAITGTMIVMFCWTVVAILRLVRHA